MDVLTISALREHPDEGIERFVDLGLKRNAQLRVVMHESWFWADREPAFPEVDRNIIMGEELLQRHANYCRELAEQGARDQCAA